MEEITHQIINYLNLGTSPTIISFPDDGIINLYDILSSLKQTTQNYDPLYMFIYLSTQALKNTDIESIENAIDFELKNKISNEKNIIETLKSGYDIVVFIDDVEIYEDPYKIVASIDGLIKKYQNKIKFIYLIEAPNIEDKFQKSFPTSSSILDAIIYFKIGTWDKNSIIKHIIKKSHQTIDTKDIEEISIQSNNYFGIFKRMIRDKLMGSKHTEDFIKYLLDNFTLEEISTFKKVLNKMKLNNREQEIVKIYAKVGFTINNEITIPLLRDYLIKYKFKQETTDDENRLNINLDLFTKNERDIIEYMHKQEEVSKEEIAKILWGKETNEKYSEWAIEQRISRLRKKLKQSGYKIDIETLYNKGYKLLLN